MAKDDRDATTPAGASDEATPTGVSDDAAPTSVSDDAKARFREALDRKKSANHRTSQGSGNTGSVHGSETAGRAQRNFRRRSGSA